MKEPRMLELAKKWANAAGIDTEQPNWHQKLVEHDKEQLRKCEYPGPDCLTPDELEWIRVGAEDGRNLSSDNVLQKHIDTCQGCATLVAVYGKGKE
jgi:hypothetical protein